LFAMKHRIKEGFTGGGGARWQRREKIDNRGGNESRVSPFVERGAKTGECPKEGNRGLLPKAIGKERV